MRPSNNTVERGDDALHKMEEFLQRFKNAFSRNDPRLVDRYLKAELEILIHLGGLNPREKYVSSLKREGAITGFETSGERQVVRNRGANACLPPNRPEEVECVHSLKESNRGKNEPVFIEVVQFVEHPEIVVPSLVRLG